jgi:hypothetical protein
MNLLYRDFRLANVKQNGYNFADRELHVFDPLSGTIKLALRGPDILSSTPEHNVQLFNAAKTFDRLWSFKNIEGLRGDVSLG